MISGIYQSAAGMHSLVRLQEIVANNLANVSTHGFKKEMPVIHKTESNTLKITGQLDLKPGAMQITDVPANLAIVGEGYFTIDTNAGPAYTRDGNFSLNNDGYLVTKEGHFVQGRNGAIIIDDSKFTISQAGEVIIKGEVVDQLHIVNGSGQMKRMGAGLMVWPTEEFAVPLEANQIQIMQGALEGSNVNVVESMVEMIKIMRIYEANQKALESQDSTLKQIISEAGKVR